MSYRVRYLIKGDYTSIDHERVGTIEVKQNHLHLYDSKGSILAIYQSGWWIRVEKI